jgi:glucosamine 6-phosphate synthetase-like amidotransferase/phosphosugar isomerase protein
MLGATGRYVEAVESLEFSRYLVDFIPEDSVVFGVSNSGTVSRTIEGVRGARERGAWTFGLTVSDQNTLAKTADVPLILNSPPNIKESPDGKRVVTPGTVTYTASLLGLYIAAIALGERIGNLTPEQVSSRLAALRDVADRMETTLAAVKEPARALAPTVTPERRVIILGGGPNYATGYFAMAKMFEAMREPAHFSELEEWAHEQYFITEANTDVFVILPPGRSRDRGLEQMEAARDMKARVIAIAAEDDEEARAASDVFFGMPAGLDETLTPFVYKLPFEYLACYMADARGAAFLGFDDPNRLEVNFRQIFRSQLQAGAKP